MWHQENDMNKNTQVHVKWCRDRSRKNRPKKYLRYTQVESGDTLGIHKSNLEMTNVNLLGCLMLWCTGPLRTLNNFLS